MLLAVVDDGVLVDAGEMMCAVEKGDIAIDDDNAS